MTHLIIFRLTWHTTHKLAYNVTKDNDTPEYKQREKFNDAYSAYAWKNKL